MKLLKINTDHTVDPPRLILSRRDHVFLGMLVGYEELEIVQTLSDGCEISFTLYKYLDRDKETVNPLWDDVTNLKFIYVPEIDEYFEIYVNTDDDIETTKSVSGVSAGKAELSQSLIYELEINTDEDIARDEYVQPTVFYDADHPEASLINRALDKLPQWTVGYVDESIRDIQRTFSASNETVYDFLTSTVAQEIGCLFVIDSVNRQINAYDLKTNCNECGYRGEFSDVCPECGSTDLKIFGTDTAIYIDQENVSTRLKFTTDTDSIKNCFRMEAGDDNMNAAIANRNPNGSMYLYYFSDDQKAEMPDELVEKIESYDELVASYDEEYADLMLTIYDTIDQISYLTSEMMPPVSFEPTTAQEQAQLLNAGNLSPVGVEKLSSSTSASTVSNVLKSYAKLFIRSGWYKVEVKESTFVYGGKHSSGYTYGTWIGNFTVTSWADDEDTADSTPIQVTVMDDYATYLEQRLEARFAEEDDEDGSVFDVLNLKDVDAYTEAITHYGLRRLELFADALQGGLDIMIEMGQASTSMELYEDIYLPLRNKLTATQEEIDKRQAEIDEQEAILAEAKARQSEIHAILNFPNYLGEDMYKLFCCYKREDVYSNSNYISDDLDNAEILEHATDFIKAASNELLKSGEYQHSISGNFNDFLAMPEFEPIWADAELGNFIHLRCDDKLYKLRLVSFDIAFDKIETIDIEFSDLTKTIDGTSDLASIVSQAKSVASSYDSVLLQMDKNKKAYSYVNTWVEKGLNATVTKIVNTADNQTQTWDEHGILCKRYDYMTEDYLDNQTKIINNGIYYTNDNWRTAKAGLGEFYYWNPKTEEYETGYGVCAETLVGNLILGEEVGIYNTSGSVQIDQDGLTMTTDRTDPDSTNNLTFTIQRKVLNDEGEVDYEQMMYVDADGHLVMNGGDITIYTTHSGDSTLEDLTNNTRLEEIVASEIEAVKAIDDERWTNLNSWINISPQGIILGETSNPLTLQISNDKIAYVENGKDVAYFSDQEMYVTDLQVTTKFTLGNFAFIPRSNGSLDFKKIK